MTDDNDNDKPEPVTIVLSTFDGEHVQTIDVPPRADAWGNVHPDPAWGALDPDPSWGDLDQ